MTTIHLKFFASLRETLSLAEETINIPDDIKTVHDLRIYLQERGEKWMNTLNHPTIRMAVNQHLASPLTHLSENAEVAFFPPVTGG
jgi:sulfur-carrier protein